MASSKKKSSKKTYKKPAARQRHRLYNEVQGVSLIAVAVFLFVCLILKEEGALPGFIAPLMLGVFGVSAYAIPFLMAGAGVCRIALKSLRLHAGKLLSTVFMLLSTVGLVHFAWAQGTITGVSNFGDALARSYSAGGGLVGMGALPALYVYPLYKLLSVAGVWILFIAMILATIILLFNFSLRETGEHVKSGIDKVSEYTREAVKRRQVAMFNENLREEAAKEAYVPAGEPPAQPKTRVRIKQYQPLEEPEEQQPEKASTVPSPIVQPGTAAANVTEAPAHKPSKPYEFPPLNLLNLPPARKGALKQNHDDKIQRLEATLRSFGINAQVVDVTVGPAITRYELTIERGTRVSRILSLADDIALSMAALSIRIEAPIPGKSAIGIEIPNEAISMVSLREVIDSETFQASPSRVSFALGKSITGDAIVADISRMPHLLIAGQTGSGKSVCINCLITSILYKATPEEVKLILVDPKKVELNVYNGIPHLLTPVVTDPKKAAGTLQFVVREMEKRYEDFARKKAKDITRYNELLVQEGQKPMFRIVVIVDELNDLMMVAQGEVEDSVMRIAQLARAAGIYLVLATQRPSVNVITGVIKANIPSRIAFAVASTHDSRTILDSVGAEKLLGRGDMLFHQNGESKPMRIQGAFVDEQEVERVVEHIKASQFEPEYIPDDQLVLRELRPSRDKNGDGGDDDFDNDDDLFPAAVEYAIECGQISISALQRRLKVGYSRAGRLIDDMEKRGIVNGSQGSKARDVLMTKQQFWDMYNKE